MIKINLLPQKRGKRASAPAEPGSREIYLGAGALAAVGLIVFFVVDQPRRSNLKKLRETNEALQQEIAGKTRQLAGYDALKKAADEADKRAKSISRLMAAKIVPANVLHELGEILTPPTGAKRKHLPTMTQDMEARVGNGPDSDPNRRFDDQWDPNHVWLLAYSDKDGAFKLDGGAQAEVDVTQLSKRMQASIYFMDVAPSAEERQVDKDSGIAYYKFTITGKVAY